MMGHSVYVSPASSMHPGERYTVTASAGAFHDIEKSVGAVTGAAYSTGYTLMTRPVMKFKQNFQTSGNNYWDTGANNFFDGHRWGAGVAMTPDSTLWVAGGKNSSFRHKDMESMNDVWSFSTKREVNCAASYEEKAPSYCDAQCSTTGGVVSLGTAALKMTVWRLPSIRGLQCTR